MADKVKVIARDNIHDNTGWYPPGTVFTTTTKKAERLVKQGKARILPANYRNA